MSEKVIELPIDDIKPSPYGHRRHFDFYSLNILAESIRKYGVLQPVSVRKVKGGNYELVSGERRLKAAKTAGLQGIPAFVLEAGEEESSVISFVENIQRKNLTYIEEAAGCKALMDDFGMCASEVAEKTGLSRSVINSRLKMLELPEKALKIIAENNMPEDIVRAVLKLPDNDLRLSAVMDIVEQDMTAKRAEDYVDKLMFCMRFGEQKVKSTFNDMKLFTNSIHQLVETLRNSGISAYYDVKETAESLEINIKVLSDMCLKKTC